MYYVLLFMEGFLSSLIYHNLYNCICKYTDLYAPLYQICILNQNWHVIILYTISENIFL